MTRPRDVLLLVRRSLRQHALSTAVTVLSTALASGLVMAVLAITAQSREAFTGGALAYDAVLGARGSKLQLVLNTIFHLQTSPGNLPWSAYEAIERDPRVAEAVPYALGDNYRGFRIVGTTDALFRARASDPDFAIESPGRPFDAERREAVIGSAVARAAGLALGARFTPYHGLSFDEEHRHEEEYVVTGVLAPTGSPDDRVIWIPIEGVLRMEGHALFGADVEYHAEPGRAIPAEHKELSAVLLRFASPNVGFALDHEINRLGEGTTLAWPIADSLAQLFDQFGWIVRILVLVAWLVALVAGGSILASIYNSMNERRRELAVLRALGARRATVSAAVVGEAAAIALLGSLAGYLVYAAILAASAAILREETGVVLAWTWHPALAWTPLAMLALGALAGLAPARKAYTTDVASALRP